MKASWWQRLKLVTWYRSEMGGWYLRIWIICGLLLIGVLAYFGMGS